MARYFFSLRIAAIVIIAAIALVTIDWQLRGYIVVADPGERAERVFAVYRDRRDTLGNQSGVRHVGRPRGDGHLEVHCQSGGVLRRGDITRGTDTIYRITESDCPTLARRRVSR